MSKNKLAKLEKSKAAYRAAKKDFDAEVIYNSISYDISNKTLATANEIIDKSTATPQVCGVYFLILQHKYTADIMYVGQSKNVFSRLASHINDPNKVFNRFAYISCEPHELDILESLYILHLHPKLNSKAGGKETGQYLTPIKHSHLMKLHKKLVEDAIEEINVTAELAKETVDGLR